MVPLGEHLIFCSPRLNCQGMRFPPGSAFPRPAGICLAHRQALTPSDAPQPSLGRGEICIPPSLLEKLAAEVGREPLTGRELDVSQSNFFRLTMKLCACQAASPAPGSIRRTRR
jgi:hypothetical protein